MSALTPQWDVERFGERRANPGPSSTPLQPFHVANPGPAAEQAILPAGPNLSPPPPQAQYSGVVLKTMSIATATGAALGFGPFLPTTFIDGINVLMSTAGAGLANLALAWTQDPTPTPADMIAGENLVYELGPAAGQPPAVDVQVATPAPVFFPIAVMDNAPNKFPYLSLYIYWLITVAGNLQVAANPIILPI